MQPDKRHITPSEVYTVFKKMSDSDLHLLGLSDEYARPEWMILTVMPVPPPPVRPSIAVDGGAMRSEDDLTYKLGDIIKASANVRRCEQEGAPAHVISEFEQLLQVTCFYAGHYSLLNAIIVPCRDLYGQRYRRHPSSSPKVWETS
jgi:DNA-directed RNA polymerase II subunit RPB1